MNKFIKLIGLAAVFLLMAVPLQAEPNEATQNVFQKLMGATVSNNYDAFVAQCDATMKASLTKPMLEGVSRLIEPRASQAYEAEYLGELKKQGYQVHLWCLHFKDGGDDILATLSMKNGQAGGFYLK